MASLSWSINNARAEQGFAEFAREIADKRLSLMEMFETRIGLLGEQLYALVEEKLSGGVLQVRTGALLSAVMLNAVLVTGMTFETSVEIPEGSDQRLIGMVHEFGGQGYYEILPVNKQALAFIVGGSTIFARRVNHPPALERSYLRSSLVEIEADVYAELQEGVDAVLDGAA